MNVVNERGEGPLDDQWLFKGIWSEWMGEWCHGQIDSSRQKPVNELRKIQLPVRQIRGIAISRVSLFLPSSRTS